MKHPRIRINATKVLSCLYVNRKAEHTKEFALTPCVAPVVNVWYSRRPGMQFLLFRHIQFDTVRVNAQRVGQFSKAANVFVT